MAIDKRSRIVVNPVVRTARWILPWIALGFVVYFIAGYWADFQRNKTPITIATGEQPSVVATSATTPTNTVPPGTTAQALIDGIKLRVHPASTGQVIASVGKGTVMTVLEQQKDWLRVRDPLGRIGWVTSSAEFVQLTIARQ